MKKYLILVLMLLIPFGVFAEERNYQVETFEEALQAENIEKTYTSYEYDDKKLDIYLFRGQGCPHCIELLEFLDSITDEYGKYFNLHIYEVWEEEHADNESLMKEVGNVFGKNVKGVPFLVIGEKTFNGYKTGYYDDQIKQALEEEYNKKDRYDVMTELGLVEKKTIDYTQLIVSSSIIIVISITIDTLTIIGKRKRLNNI